MSSGLDCTTDLTWVSAEILTAALLNTHLRDNLLETGPAKVTTAGDLLYATAANALTRLGIGTTRAVLEAGASAPTYGPLRPTVGQYMGAAVADHHVESGTAVSSSAGAVTVNFANAFGSNPRVKLTPVETKHICAVLESVGTSSFTFGCYISGTTREDLVTVHWIAEGAD